MSSKHDKHHSGSNPNIANKISNELIEILEKYKISIDDQLRDIIKKNTLPKFNKSPEYMLATPMMALKKAAEAAKKQLEEAGASVELK